MVCKGLVLANLDKDQEAIEAFENCIRFASSNDMDRVVAVKAAIQELKQRGKAQPDKKKNFWKRLFE